jgi:hypothetical protein
MLTCAQFRSRVLSSRVDSTRLHTRQKSALNAIIKVRNNNELKLPALLAPSSCLPAHNWSPCTRTTTGDAR